MSALPQNIIVKELQSNGVNKRVWLEGKRFSDILIPGEKADVKFNKNKKEMRIKPVNNILEGNFTVAQRKNGSPILDIKSQKVSETLGSDVEKIEILIFKDEIVVRVARVEHFKKTRANKNGLNTFELFCGAGTLTHFFKKAGFNIKGGLEMDEDYLTLFHENNPGDEIYSIQTSIQDLHTSYFPKNIDVALVGIPCTPYSGSNVKLKTALKNKREGKEYDKKEVEKFQAGESLTFYVLLAIKAMNPRTIVVEEVVEYSESPASLMLRSVLEQMGYSISETVSTGKHTKRKRWCLVANMGEKINLDNLLQDDGKTIEDFLEISVENRDWQTSEENRRVKGMIEKGLGIRSVKPDEVIANTFTTHRTRHTEPILQHPKNPDLYSEFTDREIANIHGLGKDFVLDERKTISRQVIGQGVTDMFEEVAKRIKSSLNDAIDVEIVANGQILKNISA